ncbi:MAG: CCA tRNA nucleotidyltransferase [Rhodospirillaceae bacterium]
MPVESDEVLEVRGISPTPLGKVPVADWLAWPEVRRLVDAFAAGGHDMRFVGGCVRDVLAKRPVSDVDLATPLPPDKVMAILQAAGIKTVPTGIDHGTVTAVVDGKAFQITTLRRDVSTDGRHAEVAYTDDWIEDAKRRDFTFNAMSCNPSGDIYDPFEGMRDLAHGMVRFVGRADDRIREDYLRILRFFRFYGYYGRPPANKNALAACRARAAKLTELSGERVRDEILKILVCPLPADVFVLMRGYGVLEQILPEAGDVKDLRLVSWLARRGLGMDHVKPEPIRHLAALLDTDADGAAGVAGRLRLSNRQADRLIALAAPASAVTPDGGGLENERLIRRLGRETFTDLVLIGWGRELGAAGRLKADRSRAWWALADFADGWAGQPVPLQGRDLLDIGMTPGPRVGEVLGAVEAWWEEGGFSADRDACLAHARALLET